MAATSLTGGCLCGAIRYRISGTAMYSCVCHCDTCRRAAGAESVGWLTVPMQDFRVETGSPATYASSPRVVRGFCSACGTTLTYQNEPDAIDITLASLDDPEAAPPTAEVWLEARLSWNPANPALNAFRRGTGD